MRIRPSYCYVRIRAEKVHPESRTMTAHFDGALFQFDPERSTVRDKGARIGTRSRPHHKVQWNIGFARPKRLESPFRKAGVSNLGFRGRNLGRATSCARRTECARS